VYPAADGDGPIELPDRVGLCGIAGGVRVRRNMHFHILDLVSDLGAATRQQVEQLSALTGPGLRRIISDCEVRPRLDNVS
jgi:hypothetical protein